MKCLQESDISREPHIVPICMPVSSDLPFEGKPAIVTGWGRLEYGKFFIRSQFHQHFTRGFFVRKFCAKLFLYLDFRFVLFLAQKAARILLVKLTLDLSNHLLNLMLSM
jgi:hypothetical protein